MSSRVILIGGLPASGKTTLAEALAKKLDAVHLNSDKTRVLLEFSGQYASSEKERIYEELMRQTEEELADETETIVVDATWRADFDALARRIGAQIYWVFLVADEEVIRQRMQYARKYSEADYNVYLHLKTVYEKMNRPCLYLHSDQLSLSDMMEQVEKYTGISKDVGAGDN